MISLTLAAVIVFVLAQLAIGAWVARRVRSDDDYLLAGRRLGVFLAGFSIFAGWFAGESILGASAAIRDEGLAGGRADPVGYALALLLLGAFLAARLRRTNAMTLPNALRARFGVGVERLTALITIPTTALYAGAQVRAFGQIIEHLSPLGIVASIVVATLVVVVYTTMGGLLGDVYTDLVQGIIILVGVLVLLIAIMMHLGGPVESLSLISRDQLTLVAPGESAFARFDVWLVPVIGALVVQETISRVLACRTEKGARRSAFFGGWLYLVFGAVPVLIGLLGAHVMVQDGEGEAFIPAIATQLLPPALHVVFLGALVAALLSTIDSSLLAVGAVVSSDLAPAVSKHLNPRQRLLIARCATVLTGVAACALALANDGIYDIVLMADGLGTAGIAVVAIAAMWIPFGGKWAAGSALVGAFATAFTLGNFTEFEAPFVASLVVAIVLYAVVGAGERLRARDA
ncbi:MAG: hypothetical protein RBS39_13455 [Phycisphaerales bacterium]|jgi:SSS family transporter|nr:hypothetical protein [Phycisphaerales bacterium]